MLRINRFSLRRVRSLVLGLALAIALLPVMRVGVAGATSPIQIPLCTHPDKTFDAGWFSTPTRITNQYLPLRPGTETVLLGTSVTGGQPSGHAVVFTVTGLTKMIDGVKTVVVWDRDFQQGSLPKSQWDRDVTQGHLTEAELSLWAQDRAGNVWNLGEYPEEYDDTGAFTGAPSTWIAGMNGAIAGLHMSGQPKVSDTYYLQGQALGIDFKDCARGYAKNLTVTVPVATYHGVFETDEISPLDTGNAHQRKFHAPGVGIVKITAVNDPEGETLSLIKLVHLSPDGLAAANAAALTLDRHGHERGVNAVYARTAPACPGD